MLMCKIPSRSIILNFARGTFLTTWTLITRVVVLKKYFGKACEPRDASSSRTLPIHSMSITVVSSCTHRFHPRFMCTHHPPVVHQPQLLIELAHIPKYSLHIPSTHCIKLVTYHRSNSISLFNLSQSSDLIFNLRSHSLLHPLSFIHPRPRLIIFLGAITLLFSLLASVSIPPVSLRPRPYFSLPGCPRPANLVIYLPSTPRISFFFFTVPLSKGKS